MNTASFGNASCWNGKRSLTDSLIFLPLFLAIFLLSLLFYTQQVDWTATMDFSSTNTTALELELPTAASGMVLLVAPKDDDNNTDNGETNIQWFTPANLKPNVFHHHHSQTFGFDLDGSVSNKHRSQSAL